MKRMMELTKDYIEMDGRPMYDGYTDEHFSVSRMFLFHGT